MFLGDVIRNKRLEKRLTQKELAENLCTQASISNLENNVSVPSVSILLSIADKLDLEFNDISDYLMTPRSGAAELLRKAKHLRSQYKHTEAYEYLKENEKVGLSGTDDEKKHYYYYMGITCLVGYSDFVEAHYNFNLALTSTSSPVVDFIDVLTNNGIGIAYDMEGESKKALTYFRKSLDLLDEFKDKIHSYEDNIEVTKIYYNTAKFYSKIEENMRSINLCTLGIELQKELNMNYDLDRLYYEKAFNFAQLKRKDEAELYYYYAEALANINGNNLAVETIKSDRRNFGLVER